MSRLLRRFFANRAGNFGMMMVFMSVPLLASVAMAIEYANISRVQSNLQNAVDSAVLYAGRYHEEHGALPTDADVERFLASNFAPGVTDFRVRIVDEQIVLDATADVPTYFMASFRPGGFQQIADATVPIGGGVNVELVMVLDNTFSMSADNKMQDLKRVSKGFVDDMAANAGDNDVRIGLVPFTNHVNVGLHNRNQPWIDVPRDEEHTEYSCKPETQKTYTNCRMETRYWDGVPYEREVCDEIPGETIQVCKDRTTKRTWRGCVGSRPEPYTLKDSTPNERFTGLMNVWCGKPLTPLTDKFAQLKTAIDAMSPTQDTYIAPGVMWGLRLLTPDVPFTEAKAPDDDLRKVMIIMTDGDNQRSANLPWSPANWGRDLEQADDWSIQACAEAKSRGVTIYSIAFGQTVSAAGKAVMRGCASSADGYYESRDADALSQAFDDIGQKINALRLSS